jgi:hypothetical protein
MATKTYIVPAAFYLDHIGRDCGETDKIIKKTRNRIIVELDESGYSDLLSDADYYWDCRAMMDMVRPSIIRSAKRTKEILELVGAPNGN